MNKLFTKIGTAMVGIAMAIGVGVAVGRDAKVEKAEAYTKIDSAVIPNTSYYYIIGTGDSGKYFTGIKTSNSWGAYGADSSAIKFEIETVSAQNKTFKAKVVGGTYDGKYLVSAGNGAFKDFDASGSEIKLGDSGAITSTASTACLFRLNGSNGYRWYSSTTGTISYFYQAGAKKTLSSISVSGDMTKKTYFVGDSWDFSGLSLYGLYEGEAESELIGTFNDLIASSDLTLTKSVATATKGTTSLTLSNISYGGKTADNKTITGITVKDIEVDLTNTEVVPSKTSFTFGETFTHEGSINVAYKDDYTPSEATVLDLEDATVSTPDTMILGKQTVTVSATDPITESVIEKSYDITVTNVGAEYVETVSLENSEYFSSPYEPEPADGWSVNGAGSNYGSDHNPYNLKMDGTGDYIQYLGTTALTYDEFEVEIRVKMVGGNSSSSFTAKALGQDGKPLTNPTIEATLSISGAQNSIQTPTATLNNPNNRPIYGVQFVFTKGSNVGVSEAFVRYEREKTEAINAQGQAFADYLSTFKTCPSGWAQRSDIVALVAEYNAMHETAKTDFASIKITDYDWANESEYNILTHEYGEGTKSLENVSALDKIKTMVDLYNKSRTGSEEELVLELPEGDFASYSFLGEVNMNNDSGVIAIIAVATAISAFAVAGLLMSKKRKED